MEILMFLCAYWVGCFVCFAMYELEKRGSFSLLACENVNVFTFGGIVLPLLVIDRLQGRA